MPLRPDKKNPAIDAGAGKVPTARKATRDRTGQSGQVSKDPPPEASSSSRTRTGNPSWQPELRARFVTQVAGGTRKAAALLDVAASQPSRWARGDSVPGPAQARMLVDLDHVLAHLLLVWGDERVARDWLTTPNAHLDGVQPLSWLRTRGTSEVVEAIRAEAAGAYP